ncbi:hypothetical protein CFAM422_011336 [Trichoderma lentiforme]|uniref:Uncharacterized protein n=1 Tax=Trichoderma lentiforme TaxID=1567552 RepID=A0A9P4X4U7_9HYPO|nr:hypothetical protein CFAM422_011336 [Trichoderma lentiforme]
MHPAAVQKFSSILGNIIQLKTNYGIQNPEDTDLFAILNNQPFEHHQYILHFAHGFYDACCKLYEPNSTFSENETNEKPQIGGWDIEPSLNDENVDPGSKKGESKVHDNSDKIQSVKSMFDNHNSSAEMEKSDNRSRAQSATTSDLSSIDSMTTISFEGVKISDGDSDVGEDGLSHLLEQTIEEFIDDARDQLLRMGAAEPFYQRPENLTTLLNSLDNSSTYVPSGLEWFSLTEKGYGDRQRGTIYYALAAVGFENWHSHEVKKVRQLNPEKGRTKATMEVSAIVLGPKPVSTTKRGEWDRRRKRLSTHLTRGRKWRQLIDVFGHGILLKNPWRLAKTKTPDLEYFIKELKNDRRKCLVALMNQSFANNCEEMSFNCSTGPYKNVSKWKSKNSATNFGNPISCASKAPSIPVKRSPFYGFIKKCG